MKNNIDKIYFNTLIESRKEAVDKTLLKDIIQLLKKKYTYKQISDKTNIPQPTLCIMINGKSENHNITNHTKTIIKTNTEKVHENQKLQKNNKINWNNITYFLKEINITRINYKIIKDINEMLTRKIELYENE